MTRPIQLRHILWTLVAAHIAFTVMIVAFSDPAIAALLAGARLSVGLGVIVAYAPVILEAPRHRPLTTGVVLSLGILLGWISHAILGGYTLLIQAGITQPNVVLLAWASLLADFSGMMHLAAAKAIDGTIPLRGWLRAGLWTASGMAFALCLVALYAMSSA